MILFLALLALSSCSVAAPTEPPTSIPVDTNTPSPSPTPSPLPTEEAWRSLDLRYAQVLEVKAEIVEGNDYRFDVTLVHDDQGEAPQFADWWQVEDLEGILLGKRILTHGHGTQPFTRSATITIPDTIQLVIIRGHDMQHGFGGQVIELNLITGEQRFLPD